jgi:hypothetical protein
VLGFGRLLVRAAARHVGDTEVAGQLTAAGIANAVTSYSQTIPDADRADNLDDLALHAMTLV